MATPVSPAERPVYSRLTSFWRTLSPPQLFVGSFLLLVVLGTVGFKVLPGLYTGDALGWRDALFTATSAICVTGLIVVDTATYFTFWGQAYILLLIQLGGLGIISFTSLIIVALGRRMSLRHEALAGGPSTIAPEIDYRDLTWAIFRFTFLTELAGATLLYLCWGSQLGWRGAVWPSVFHSISAFCNAGFSTFTDSLMGFQHNAPLLAVVMLLIISGGIGFLTLEEVWKWGGARRTQRFRLSIHSQIVLITTALLIVGGWGLYTVFEWQNTLADLPPSARFVNGLFASVTARTAGFNTINYGEATASTNFLTIILMSVGGSPGSMAGGLKTTTIALLGLVALSRLRGLSATNVFGRTIPDDTVQRAASLFVLAFGIVTAAIFAFSITELPGALALDDHGQFLGHMFEAVSAFNTVGLSMGETGYLSTPGRLLTVVLMFVGRVGPLSVAAAMMQSRSPAAQRFRYAHEDVIVG